MMRHKDAIKCPFGALALYFFYRWHIGDEPWPDFSEPRLWYDIYVLKGATPFKKTLYSNQYNAIKIQHEKLGVQTTVGTQSGRKSAAAAENMGARGESVDKQGHWAVKSRNGAYANNVIPWDCVRVLAGFGPKSNRYYIPRDLVDPPPELLSQIFPNLDNSRDIMLQGKATKTEIAGTNFMDLLQYMRRIILQEAVILLNFETFKTHPIFTHSIFNNSMFNEFAINLRSVMQNTPTPDTVLLQQTMPIVAESLQDIRKDAASVNRQLLQVSSHLLEIKKKIDEQSQINSSAVNTTFCESLRDQVAKVFMEASMYMSLNLSKEASHPMLNEVIETGHQLNASARSQDLNNSTLNTCVLRMSRQVYTVKQAWIEYKHGLPPYQSIQSIEAKFGSKWRKTNTDTQFYLRRKPLFDAIEKLMQDGNTEADIIAQLEDLCLKFRGLRALCTYIKQKLDSFDSTQCTSILEHMKCSN